MQDIIELIFEKLDENWVKFITAGVFMLLGWVIGRWRSRRNFERREFLDRMLVSLNMIEDGTLKIRTMLEMACEDVFLNSSAVQAVIEAAKRTKADDPVLPLPKEDYWYYLNAVLNEISERFCNGTLKREMGQAVQCETYVIYLTCESAPNLRQRKIRAMMIRESLLLNLPEELPKLESPTHDTRWNTLRWLAKDYQSKSGRFITLEVCV
ncbi:MAG: hypothetical protein KDA80_00840 [Planctomycetaceae bacterium]|nr:hypothetical protein [Planctomycetaceae bacterium]